MLTAKVDVPVRKKTSLALDVSHHPSGDWQLIVKANGERLYDGIIEPKTVSDGWKTVTLDLTAYAGKEVSLELHNQANGWMCEFGYWGRAKVASY